MLTLYGVPVTAENARHIVATLIAAGGPPAINAAARIQLASIASCTPSGLSPRSETRSWPCSRIRRTDWLS
jgi:hypothetical protein